MNFKGTFLLYRLALALLSPVIFLYFAFRVSKNRKYASTLWHRLGFLPAAFHQTVPGAIWFHAVSVGEVIALTPLIHRIHADLPAAPLFLSVSTLTGFATATERLAPVMPGIFYAPFDFAFSVRRVLRTLRPTLLIIAETEIWPNLFREAKRTGCGLLIVNARISDSALPHYLRWHRFFRRVLSFPDLILTQSDAMTERFLAAGASPTHTQTIGNLKYDMAPRATPPDHPLRAFFAHSKVLIAASTSADTHLEEEDAILAAFAQLPTGWKLLIAPRHPERFDSVARKIPNCMRRSQLEPNDRSDILLLDTIGELAGLFDLATVVFMGGTLVERGGHNILEPALAAKPIVIGPHMENFREIAADFHASQALIEIFDPSTLTAAILTAAADPQLGLRARACAESKRGALERTAILILETYRQSFPSRRRSLPARLLLTPFAYLWRAGSRRRTARHLRAQRRLPARVISIGNITAGGTGKTPLVLYTAKQLRAAGRNPGMLTRGYGRRSPHESLILTPGDPTASRPTHTGDEPQMLLRSGSGPVGIGGDRYTVGRLLLERFQNDTLILDDGFQHLRLARDLDIVLIDALNPFGDFEVLPLGRLREPIEALARASAFVITRSHCPHAAAAIEAKLRLHNPRAPVFRSRVVPVEWVDSATGITYPATALPFERTLAFCGLGNPESFWSTLRRLHIHPFECLAYGDHHIYTAREIRRFGQLGRAHHIQAALTTEKDAINFVHEGPSALDPMKLLWLRIELEIENEPAFLALLTS